MTERAVIFYVTMKPSKFIVHIVNSACGLTVHPPEDVCHVLFELKIPMDERRVRLIEKGVLAFV